MGAFLQQHLLQSCHLLHHLLFLFLQQSRRRLHSVLPTAVVVIEAAPLAAVTSSHLSTAAVDMHSLMAAAIPGPLPITVPRDTILIPATVLVTTLDPATALVTTLVLATVPDTTVVPATALAPTEGPLPT